jgi:hypothetical protein
MSSSNPAVIADNKSDTQYAASADADDGVKKSDVEAGIKERVEESPQDEQPKQGPPPMTFPDGGLRAWLTVGGMFYLSSLHASGSSHRIP